MALELRVSNCAGHLCDVRLGERPSLAELNAAVEVETGVDPKDQALFHGLDELLFDGDVAALGAAGAAELLLVHSPNQRVRSLVNRLCADNLGCIAEQLARIDVRSAQELVAVCRIIYEKAVAEPHCGETCAELVLALRGKFPEFPAEDADGRSQTFRRTLLTLVQTDFEELLGSHEWWSTEGKSLGLVDAESWRLVDDNLSRRMANMSFIGFLFLRELFIVKVVGLVVDALISNVRASPPSSQDVECVLALLRLIGAELDSRRPRRADGRNVMTHAARRLMELQIATRLDGQPRYSAGLQRQIQDLLDARARRQAQ